MKIQLFHKTANLTHAASFGVARSPRVRALLLIFLSFGIVTSGLATDLATADLSSTPLGGGVFGYTLTLDNTGTNNLETFWYAWVPGQDYLPVSPTNILSPAGWSAIITGGGTNNGFAIQWTTSSAATPVPLVPGASFTFGFTEAATPATLAGSSSFYPGTPTGTSFVYSGAPFSDAGDKFVVASVVPEPSSLASFGVGVLCLGWVGLRRSKTGRAILPTLKSAASAWPSRS